MKQAPNIFLTIGAMCTAMFITLAVSCSKPTETPGQFRDIPESGWKYGEALVFSGQLEDSSKTIRKLIVSVRHTNDYPYANLWTEVAYSHNDSIVADTVNIAVADKFGKWFGSGTGPSILVSDTIVPRFTPDKGADIAVRHIMRVEHLKEIEQIGLTFITD